MKPILCYGILLGMTLIGSTASLFLKRASGNRNFVKIIKSYSFYLGGGLYVISALLNIILLRYLDYSVILPMTSITYIWTMVLSIICLKEQVRWNQWAGALSILIGAALIAA